MSSVNKNSLEYEAGWDDGMGSILEFLTKQCVDFSKDQMVLMAKIRTFMWDTRKLKHEGIKGEDTNLDGLSK